MHNPFKEKSKIKIAGYLTALYTLVYYLFMDKISFPNTRKIQEWIINNVMPDDLVLAAGGRMARQILDIFRKGKLEGTEAAWLPVQVMSLNEWLRYTWIEMWPEYILAPELKRLFIWLKSMEKVPPPGKSFEGLSVALELDENYAILIRHMIDPCKRNVNQPVARWSYELTRIFFELMRSEGLVHPVELPAIICKAILGKEASALMPILKPVFISDEVFKWAGLQGLSLPNRIILVGLDQAAPIEKALFSCLDMVADVLWLEIQEPLDQSRLECQAFSFPDALQETQWVVEKAVESSGNFPLHRIGIAVSDMKTYEGCFERILIDILGERSTNASSSFNITMGRPVLQSSLIQAAILPIKIMLDGHRRTHIFSLLQSPYYREWKALRHELAMLDKSWRKANINRDFKKLMDCIIREYPGQGRILKDIFDSLSLNLPLELKYEVTKWNRSIQNIWSRFGFPVIAGEEDRIAWEHLQDGIAELDKELGEDMINLKEYFKWLSYFLANKLFSIKGYENAGLQIMGLIEARGLSFDQLFITGMVSGALPQPVRSLPFLSPEERRKVQGGTAEDQYRFADVLFRNLVAASPNVILTRPEQRAGELLIPSPFYPEENKRIIAIDLWNIESPVWERSVWLSQTRRGVAKGEDNTITESVLKGVCTIPIPIPPSISVTALEDGIACPFRFFILHCLGIALLDEPEAGILPRARGVMVHRCLASFVENVRRRGLDIIADWEEAKSLLREEAERLLSPLEDSFLWHVELRRWISDGKSGHGLLYKWLEEEKINWSKGFRWLATELPFSDLQLGMYNIKISGRIDRVDFNPEDGLICWDYKTGYIPTDKDILELRTSQILAYLLALEKGLTGLDVPPETVINCGFIQLESASKVKFFKRLKEEEDKRLILTQWEARVLALLDKLVKGDIRPSPIIPSEGGEDIQGGGCPSPIIPSEGGNKEQCKGCPVMILCGYLVLNQAY